MNAFRILLVPVICLTAAIGAAAQTPVQGKTQNQSAASNKPRVNDALSVALKTAADTARKQEIKRVLVVVREDSRGEDEGDGHRPQGGPALLAGYRKRLVEELKELKLEPSASTQIERLAALTRPMGLMKTDDVRVLKNFAEFDAVLDAVYRPRGARGTLGLTLITEGARLWVRTVVLPASAAAVGVAAQTPDGGNGTATNPGANKPPANAGNPFAAIGVLNRRVLLFALSQLGRKVGNGECWTLADQALRHAGARRAKVFNFGRQIPLAQIQPGDILQFESVKFQTGGTFYLFGSPDHTAIVLGVQGTKVAILHQNFGKKIVSTMTIDFKTMTQGKVWAWRPIAG